MKEVLTKKFWQDVKKTFDEARAETAPEGIDPGPTNGTDVSPNTGDSASVLPHSSPGPSTKES